MNELVKRVADAYERNPVIRGLIQLLTIPFGLIGVADSVLTAKMEKIREDRLRIFFNELGSGQIELTNELFESEDFLHCYFATVSAVLRTRRKEKIQMFARLLNSTLETELISDTDEYEEYLAILDELSYRELLILAKLETFQAQTQMVESQNDLQRASGFWEEFKQMLENDLDIPDNQHDSKLTRLNRTGCYETFTGSYLGYTGGKGKLTPVYFKLKELIKSIS